MIEEVLNAHLVMMWQDYWFIWNSHTDHVRDTTDNLCIDSIDSWIFWAGFDGFKGQNGILIHPFPN